MRRACFFDRDGVINVDYGYVGHVADFTLISGVARALARIRQAGYLLILTTNQSGIARGRYSVGDFLTLSGHMQRLLAQDNAQFDGIYYCPHHPQGQVSAFVKDCSGRKPGPGMLMQAAQDFNLDLSSCLMIGDHAGDVLAAQAAGLSRLYLVGAHLHSEAALCPQARCYRDVAALVQEEFK